MEHRLSEKWIKASITGTIWAASEIVLGSFLHNLRIPFGGNILTAIGIVILISISFVWTERGIFWRAGLICALLKTLSPSAVIFGPMIAIFTESLLMELSVLAAGRSIPGYLIGSMLAMSWNLFQKIANYLIMYGADITMVYSSLLKWTQKQLNIQTDIVWLPIIVLLVLFTIFGMISGITGIMVGKRLLRQPGPAASAGLKNNTVHNSRTSSGEFNYSVFWLFGNIILMIASFVLLNTTKWIFWSTFITGIIIIWSVRYKRALRQLSRPKFWIFFVLITLLTAFVFTKAQDGVNRLTEGLLTGIQMNFRAALVIFGFSVIGTELYNPVIRSYFSSTSFRNLPLALELSAESLPAFIANIPDLKSLMRNPVDVFHKVISQAEIRLSEIKDKPVERTKVFIVTGPVGGGKTTFTESLVRTFKENGIAVQGIISRKIMSEDGKRGYNIVNVLTNEREPFLREDNNCGDRKVGRFTICNKGLEEGKKILISHDPAPGSLTVIDEIGFLELEGDGWAGGFERLLDKPDATIVITTRLSLLDKVRDKWKLDNSRIFDIRQTDHLKAARIIAGNSGKLLEF
jgi:nucleoside-triphosphatase THEP1